MAIAFEVEATVARSADVVWKQLTDWGAAPKWMNGIDDMTSSGPTAVGTTLRFHARGKERTSEITHLVDGRELTLTSHQGRVSANYTYRCEPEGDGTRLSLKADCEIRGPMKIFGPVLRPLIARADGGQLDALKQLVEAG